MIRFRIVFQLLEPGLKKGNEDSNLESIGALYGNLARVLSWRGFL